MNAELSEDDRRRWRPFGADRSGAQTEPASRFHPRHIKKVGSMRQAAILPTRRHRLHLAFHARCRAVAKVPSSRASTNQAPWLVAYAKKRSARRGAGRPVDVRFAPTGAERRPNPRAGPIPVPKIAQKKKRETGIEPATPTLARWCSTAEPLAHLSAPLTLITIHHLRTCVKRLSKVFRFVLIFCIVYTDLQI